MGVIVARCELFNDTAKQYLIPGSAARKSYDMFLKTKNENPTALHGSVDKFNPAGTPMAMIIPKIRHAHLAGGDLSIFYTILGAPTVLKLYAVLTHDEAGTGQPLDRKKNKRMGTKMSHQDFIR